MQFIYSLLYTLIFVLALPYFLIVGIWKGKYLRTVWQRFGFVPVRSALPSIWIHTVSVGEFLAARPLIQAILNEMPGVPCFISTTTVTGQKLARAAFAGKTFYFPFDWKWCVRRVLRKIKPSLVLVLETEIWPNFLWTAAKEKVPVVLVNGRLSLKSFDRYMRLRKWLPRFAECLMQTSEDARR